MINFKRLIGGTRAMMESLLTIPELMDFLQVKRNTIYTLRNLGLPTVKIGRSVRFRADSVIKWLAEQEHSNSAANTTVFSKDGTHLL